jgi:hypothetical protein
MHSDTTMLWTNPYPLANPSHFQSTVPTWQKYLPASRYFILVPCTSHIINSVCGENDDVHLALGGPRGNLPLICCCLLALFKTGLTQYIFGRWILTYLSLRPDHEASHLLLPVSKLYFCIPAANLLILVKLSHRELPRIFF